MIPVGSQGLTFEVASVKANTAGDRRSSLQMNLPDSFTATNLPLLPVISLVYEVPGFGGFLIDLQVGNDGKVKATGVEPVDGDNRQARRSQEGDR